MHYLILPLGLTLLVSQSAADIFVAMQDSALAAPNSRMWNSFLGSWLGFTDWRLLMRASVSLATGIALASAIAFHPEGLRHSKEPKDFERPRTLLLYALVGTLVAEVVSVAPAMALVVFGIGGLLRFRTDVGAASDTGRVILVTIIGIATGLGLFPYAVLATIVGWVLIYVLARRPLYTVEIEGLHSDQVDRTLTELSTVLSSSDMRLVSQFRNRMKGEATLVVRGRPTLTDAGLEDLLMAWNAEREHQLKWRRI